MDTNRVHSEQEHPKEVVVLGHSAATVDESLQEGMAKNYASLPRPSGPFPWAPDEEELEALYAEQAGQR